MFRALLFVAAVWLGLQIIGPVFAVIGGGLALLAGLVMIPILLVLGLSVGLPLLIILAVFAVLLAPLLLPLLVLLVVIKLAIGGVCAVASAA